MGQTTPFEKTEKPEGKTLKKKERKPLYISKEFRSDGRWRAGRKGEKKRYKQKKEGEKLAVGPRPKKRPPYGANPPTSVGWSIGRFRKEKNSSPRESLDGIVGSIRASTLKNRGPCLTMTAKRWAAPLRVKKKSLKTNNSID